MHDVLQDSPPPEVLAAIAVAGRSYEQLQAADLELSFDLDDRTGRVTVTAKALDGSVLCSLCPSAALAIAGGEGLA